MRQMQDKDLRVQRIANKMYNNYFDQDTNILFIVYVYLLEIDRRDCTENQGGDGVFLFSLV